MSWKELVPVHFMELPLGAKLSRLVCERNRNSSGCFCPWRPQLVLVAACWQVFAAEIQASLRPYVKNCILVHTASHSGSFVFIKYSLLSRISELRGLWMFHVRRFCQIAFRKAVWKKSRIVRPPGESGENVPRLTAILHFYDYE